MGTADSEDSLFTKIVRREIPADIVYETEKVIAFRDIHPQAPFHVLVVPKKPLVNLSSAEASDTALLGELLFAVREIAAQHSLEGPGYRVVINNGKGAGQAVFHLHLHILSKRVFNWPPG
jgi:histidine triad (HIT) family protein